MVEEDRSQEREVSRRTGKISPARTVMRKVISKIIAQSLWQTKARRK